MKENKFAAQDPHDLTSYLRQHINSWGSESTNATLFSSVCNTWRRNLMAYYSPMLNARDWQTSLNYLGEQGEYVGMVVPEARIIIRQLATLVTKQRLAVECLADSTDAKTLQAARLGRAICNQVIDEYDLESKLFAAVEQAYVVGAGYVTYTWRTDMGYPYSANPDNSMNYSGDVCFESPDVRDVMYDWTVQNWVDTPWVIIRQQRSRWDLIAQFPDLEKEILSQPSIMQSRRTMNDLNYLQGYEDTDRIFVYEFYHKQTASLPKGRMTFFLDDDTPIYDDENLYECLPIYQFKFENIMQTGLGYALLSSLLPAQEMLDQMFSTQATNLSAFGVQSLLCPDGANISAHNIAGLNFINYKPAGPDGGGKPEALQLTASPAELPAFMKTLSEKVQSLSSLNSAIRGEPPAGVTAGTAIATLSANAQEFLTSASKQYVFGIEKILMGALANYARFATVPRLTSMVGDQEAYLAKEFVGDDLKSIKRVKIRTTSPLMNSQAGRLQVADSLLTAGLISRPQSYVGLLEGAPLETLFDTELTEEVALQGERDALLEGKPVYPLISDDHPKFIRSNLKLLYNPDVRANPEISQRVLEVNMERLRLEQECPPELKAMLRTGQAPQMPPPGAPPSGGNKPPEGGMMPQEPTAQVAQPAEPLATV